MPRRHAIVGGYPYHVLNRANGRLRLFRKQNDFEAFERVLAETFETHFRRPEMVSVPLRFLIVRTANRPATAAQDVKNDARLVLKPALNGAGLSIKSLRIRARGIARPGRSTSAEGRAKEGTLHS